MAAVTHEHEEGERETEGKGWRVGWFSLGDVVRIASSSPCGCAGEFCALLLSLGVCESLVFL